MRRCVGVILTCMAVFSALGQTSSPKYQPGTIMSVTEHRNAGQQATEARQYDVSVKVGNTTFVVLLTPPNGSNTVTYALGDELLVLVGNDTLTFNAASVKTEVPILRRETLQAQSLDWSMTPSQYFSIMQQHLSGSLLLTDSQQSAIKPILEQEAGEIGALCANPALSDANKLKQYSKIARTSDEKLKPLLSADQLGKLQTFRAEQKQDLKKLIAKQPNGKHG